MRAIIHQSYDVKVEGHEVFLNNIAFLKCTVSSHIREFVEITSWYRGDELLTDNSDISEYNPPLACHKRWKIIKSKAIS